MTLTELEEIKKLARDPKSAAFHDLMARQTIPLVEALREAWKERDEAREDERLAECRLDEIVELTGSGGDGSAFGSVESLLCDLEERTEERNEARAEVERLKAALEEVREKNGSLADRIEKTDSELRDAWKAEDRLEATLRLLWEEATDEERCANERSPGCYSHVFSQPCREAVEAALKDSP